MKKLSIAAVEKLTCRHLHFYLHAPFCPREQLGSFSESPIYQATPQAQRQPQRQYLLTNTINRIEGAIELSQDQAANIALGFSADQCSHKFWNCYVGAAVAFVQRTKTERFLSFTLDSDQSDDNICEDGSEDEGVRAYEDEGFCGLEKDLRPGCRDDGGTEIYTGASGNVTAVPMFIHYAHRGVSLDTMTFYEYCACVLIAPFSAAEIADNLEEENTQAIHAAANRKDINNAGRKCNKTFPFDEQHPLCKSHKQQLRSMQKIPVPVPPPPRMPEGAIFQDQQKAAQAAAAYFMVLFSPWSWEKLPRTTHAEWAEYCSQLQNEGSVLTLHRLAVMTSMSHGLGISTANDKAGTSFRNRNVQKWNSRTPDGTARPPGPGHDGTSDDENHQCHINFDAQSEDSIAHILALSKGALTAVELERRIKKMNKEEDRIEALMQHVHQAFPLNIDKQIVHPSLPCGNSSFESVPFEIRSGAQSELAINWLSSEAEAENVVDEVTNSGKSHFNPESIEWPNTDALTSTQLELMQIIKPLLLLQSDDPNYNQTSSLLIHGGPGTGKSFFVKQLATFVNAAMCKMRCGAFAACASQLLPFANTIHSLFSIPMEFGANYKPLKDKELTKQRNVWKNVRVIVIDEISMVPEILLGWTSMRLRQIMDVPLPYGGLISVLMGDFFQIPSILRPTLIESVLLAAAKEYTVVPGSVSQEAVNIMLTIRCYHFTIQKRSEDPQWTGLLQTVRDTGSMQPIIQHLRHIRDISAAEAATWIFPTVAVTGNAFRERFNYHQLQRFSRIHALPLIRWTNEIVKASPTSDKNVLIDRSKYDFRLSQSFCYGAPVTLNENISPMSTEKGVSNGTRCTFHCISGSSFPFRDTFIDVENDVWIDTPQWVVVATVDKFSKFPGIPPEALTEDGRLLVCLKNKRSKTKITLEVVTLDKRLQR